MKKILLSVALLGSILATNAQTTTVFENNFNADDALKNLVIGDYDKDGDNGIGWYGVPASGFPPAFTGAFIVFDGRLKSGGEYDAKTPFDFNVIETKDPVTIPSGGSAELSFDLITNLRSTNTAYDTNIYVTIYDNNTDYNVIKTYAFPASTTTGYVNAKIDIAEGLGNSYIYEIAQYDDPRVQSEFLLDNLKITHTPALSTDEFLASKFSVYPNPANNVVNIANGENMMVNKVTVTDLNGRTVKNVSFDNVANVQVNVSDLASGLYLMNITSDKGTATKKFVKN